MLKISKLILVILSITLSYVQSRAIESSQEQSPMVEPSIGQYQESKIVHTPSLKVDVWVNRGDGATYYPGENIRVYFRTSQDCYLMIYSVDTRGDVNILYPYDRTDAPWVEGGKAYRIPDKYDDYDLRISGPEGTEYVRAVASLEPFALPGWPRYAGKSKLEDIETLKMEKDGDPFEFMQQIDCEVVPYCDDYASGLATFQVEYRYPCWYYYPNLYCDRYPWCCNSGGAYFISEPFGAEIWIDGIYYGIAPMTIPYLLVGRHYVCFYFSGCWVWRDYVYVEREHTINVRADIDSKYRYVDNYVVKKDYRTKTTKGYIDNGKSYRSSETKKEIKNPVIQQKDRIKLQDREFIEPRIPERTYQNKTYQPESKDIKARVIESRENKNPESRSPDTKVVKEIQKQEPVRNSNPDYEKVKKEETKTDNSDQARNRNTVEPRESQSKPQNEERQNRTERTNPSQEENGKTVRRR